MTGGHRLVVDVAEALRQPGVRRPLRRCVPLPDLALSSARVPEDADVDVELVLEAVGADIVVSGHVHAPWQGSCRRCLEPVQGDLDLDVREVFERRPTEGETYPIEDDERIDVEPMVRDAVLLALPLSPLCRGDCVGPDPGRYPAAAEPAADEDEDRPAERPRDPRWAALDDFRPED